MQEPTTPPPGAEGFAAKQVDQAPHVLSVESAPKRATPQDVEQARAEKEAAYTQLMDEMEKSAETQGGYFVKLGQKKPITENRPVTTAKFMGFGKTTTNREETVGYTDDRALILKATRTRKEPYIAGEVEEFVVVTPDGIKVIRFNHSEIDNPQSGDAINAKADYDRLKDLTSGKIMPDDSNRYQKPSEESRRGPAIVISRDRTVSLREPSTTSTVSGDFQNAIQESIKITESPFKKNVEDAVREKKVATDTIAAIHSLPPRA